MVKLSKRLEAVCNMVPSGRRICDVGCDHAYVDIRLLQEERIPFALAMDVAKGPLEKARENLELTELADRCELRRSDGLAAYEPGEADTMICTGMGGLLMRSILEESVQKVLSFKELILSPQREPWLVREWLRRSGCVISDEIFLKDAGQYYTVMLVHPAGERPETQTLNRMNAVYSVTEKDEHNMMCRTDVPGEFSDSLAGRAMPVQPAPDWDTISEEISALSEGAMERSMLDRSMVLTMLADPSFREGVCSQYGPCVLRKFLAESVEDADGSRSAFRSFVMQGLRSKLQILQHLASHPGSDNAAHRMQQLRGEIGVLQVLLFLHCRNALKEQPQQNG